MTTNGKSLKGFTLIELVIVITILGILAFTAAPRFLSLSSDAKAASLQGLKGSVQAANQLVYSKSIIEGQDSLASGSITYNEQTINTRGGYIAPELENIRKVLNFSSEELTNITTVPADEWGTWDNGNTIIFVPSGTSAIQSGSSELCLFAYTLPAAAESEPIYFYFDEGC